MKKRKKKSEAKRFDGSGLPRLHWRPDADFAQGPRPVGWHATLCTYIENEPAGEYRSLGTTQRVSDGSNVFTACFCLLPHDHSCSVAYSDLA